MALQKIEHVYLEKGHTQNENDSVHSTIERATRHVPVYTPEQWCTAVRSARREKPYVVNEMACSDFLDFNDLSIGHSDILTQPLMGRRLFGVKLKPLHF